MIGASSTPIVLGCFEPQWRPWAPPAFGGLLGAVGMGSEARFPIAQRETPGRNPSREFFGAYGSPAPWEADAGQARLAQLLQVRH